MAQIGHQDRPPISRALIENPEHAANPGKTTSSEVEVKRIMQAGVDQEPIVFKTVTYEYWAPFFYPNFFVELGDTTKGAEYNGDGIELDVPPYGAITFTHDEPIVGVEIIASSCCSPGTVYLNCEPIEWKYARSGLKFKKYGLWGEHLRAYMTAAGVTEEYKKCGLFSAYFSIPDSKKITVMGHGSFDMEKRDYETDHYDAHLTVRAIRVTVKKTAK